ncbi:MAG: hypothetical protein ACOY4I_14245 [Bacillota bacterium]
MFILPFLGNSGGFTDSFFGLGLFTGMAGAALAGHSIAERLDFEKMVSPIMRQMERLQTLRKVFNHLDNGGIDRLAQLIPKTMYSLVVLLIS